MNTHDISGHQHTHIFHYSSGETEKRTMFVVLLTVVTMAVEIVAGWMFNSMALLADGWHMSTHAVALGISWVAFVLARRYAGDRSFAFGTWKIEILGGFVSAILLGIVGLAMVGMSVLRLLHPVDIQFNHAILVAIIGFVVNLASMLILRDHHGGHHGHDHHEHHDHDDHDHHESIAISTGNLNLKAAYLHVVADALTSVLAIAALVGGKFFGWNWLDPTVGILGAIMILRWTRSLLVDAGGILLDREGNDELAGEIEEAIESEHGTRISDLHVWRVGQDKYACIVALVSDAPQPLQHYKERLAKIHELAHVTVEVRIS